MPSHLTFLHKWPEAKAQAYLFPGTHCLCSGRGSVLLLILLTSVCISLSPKCGIFQDM
jgi:hypothetical protein